MTRLHDWDDDSVIVGIVPQTCGNCGDRTDRARISLEVVIRDDDLLGIRTIATTPCCNGKRAAAYPADMLAELLDHLKHCPHHEKTV
ncbi:hypothetical protein ACPCSE_29980 [Streptomyces cellulosae]